MGRNTMLHAPKVTDVKLNGVFWEAYDLDKMEALMDHQLKAFENTLYDTPTSGALHSLRILAGKIKDEEPHGVVWQDSDLFKWYEGLCYFYAMRPSEKWRKVVDEIADMLEKAQAEDGYYNSHFLLNRGGKRLENLHECHELYSMGHIIEACIAHHAATGNDQLLQVAIKMADLIDSVFGLEKDGKLPGYPGHQEIELALMRLYALTGEKRYLECAYHFLDQRGTEPLYYVTEWEKRGHTGYWKPIIDKPIPWIDVQTHIPLREQMTAEGHAVRAAYMYAAMADVAFERNDEAMIAQCKAIWNNIIHRRSYVTGGIGGLNEGEKFGADYELPEACHCETCAAVALVFFAQRMFHALRDSQYTDVIERTIFNNVLASTAQDAKHYFYINVLRRDPRDWHVHHGMQRPEWQGTACCPTNVARFFPSMQTFTYSIVENDIYVNLYANGTADLDLSCGKVHIEQTTDYPWDGKIKIQASSQSNTAFTIHLRIPGWCKSPGIKLNGQVLDLSKAVKGYLAIERQWQASDIIELDFPMSARLLRPHPCIDSIRGRLAVERGPIVYCLEEIDNGKDLQFLALEKNVKLEARQDPSFFNHAVLIEAEGYRFIGDDDLYKPYDEYRYEDAKLKFIPYYLWDNRGNGEMLIWILEK